MAEATSGVRYAAGDGGDVRGLGMCRAVKVLCVAEDDERLAELKRATVAASWELCPGATDTRSALDQIDTERPHMLVAFGPGDPATPSVPLAGELVRLAAERFPGMRIVTDRDAPGATAVAASSAEVRELLGGQPRPGGPVG